jgi:hypothetical protein
LKELTMYRIFARTSVLAAVALVTGCMTPPPNLDLSLTRPTLANHFKVTMQPPATPPAVNQIHSWQIKLASPTGQPISHARIAVDGGMPQHGHGLPTKPRVTKELEDGTYLLEGMKFSMTGWWEIKLAIEAPEGADKVTFNTIVSPPAVAR